MTGRYGTLCLVDSGKETPRASRLPSSQPRHWQTRQMEEQSVECDRLCGLPSEVFPGRPFHKGYFDPIGVAPGSLWAAKTKFPAVIPRPPDRRRALTSADPRLVEDWQPLSLVWLWRCGASQAGPYPAQRGHDPDDAAKEDPPTYPQGPDRRNADVFGLTTPSSPVQVVDSRPCPPDGRLSSVLFL